MEYVSAVIIIIGLALMAVLVLMLCLGIFYQLSDYVSHLRKTFREAKEKKNHSES